MCNYYKEPGHWQKDFPKNKKKDYVPNDSSLENNFVLDIGEQPQQHFEQQVLDSGCSYHICPHISQFVTYEDKYCGNVLMGNNDPCKSIDICSIQIRMHDGIVRTLTEVRHV